MMGGGETPDACWFESYIRNHIRKPPLTGVHAIDKVKAQLRAHEETCTILVAFKFNRVQLLVPSPVFGTI